MRRRILPLIAMLVVGVVVLSACEEEKGRAASELLPNISQDEYDIIHNDSLEDTLQGTLVGLQVWDLISQDPGVVGRILTIDDLLDCTAETGATAVRLYSNKTYRYVAGAAIVVNYDRLTSWQTAAACLQAILLPPAFESYAATPEVRPCANWWEYTDGEANYYLVFAATSPDLCQLMCSTMNGCPGPEHR
jgi:hypothetical protein